MISKLNSLLQLEELVISNNRIQSLPNSIGRLENLKILLTDVNALTWLPSSIGQCRSLRILNVASNNLLSLPEEIGHLKELRVLNLANNYLRYLPQTVADLPNLTALWLNDNQKKPLVMLQVERDDKNQNPILTCFMFPQTGPIFGPVSPAAAAALLAQQQQQQQKQQQLQQQQSDAVSRDIDKDMVIDKPIQTVALGVLKQQNSQNQNQQQQMLQNSIPTVINITNSMASRPPTIDTRSGSHILDDEEDDLARHDMLQTSNVLNKNQAYIQSQTSTSINVVRTLPSIISSSDSGVPTPMNSRWS